MKIGSEVPEVTCMAFRWVFRLGMARPAGADGHGGDNPDRQEPVEEREAGDDRGVGVDARGRSLTDDVTHSELSSTSYWNQRRPDQDESSSSRRSRRER